MSEEKQKIKHLIVDTTAFLKNTQLQDVAENMITCQEVVDEVKNDKQLSRLVVLPYNLQLRQPFPESLRHVSEFAKKTGDYATLSLTDLTVIALAYEIEKAENGDENLKEEPQVSKTIYAKSKPKTDEMESKFAPPGFYLAKVGDSGVEVETEEELVKRIEELTCEENENSNILVKINEEEDDEDQEEEDEGQEDGSSDSDEGWITPSNIKAHKADYTGQTYEDIVPNVACMTSDFAMQNVLKQLGIHVTASDGRVIRHTRTFILRCYGCFRTTTDVTKIFCPRCGNKTLKRVSVSVDGNGKQVIHINTRKPLTAKFKNQPLPAPKGGKHACNPILFEDQPIPQQRLSKKAMVKTNALDEDYIAGYSPFVLRDTDSRSAMLRNTSNIKQWMKNYEYDNHRRGYKKGKK